MAPKFEGVPDSPEAHEEASRIDALAGQFVGAGLFESYQAAADEIVESKLLENESKVKEKLGSAKEVREPALRINEKGIVNSYLEGHLFGKEISLDLVRRCLGEGKEVTSEIKHAKEGSRYFKLEIPDGAGLPGRIVLPEEDGPYGGQVANLNLNATYKFRHGRLAACVPREALPEWLVKYESALYVIVDKNQLPDGVLQVEDGPTENDPEGSWVVVTAHYGAPARWEPRLPKKPTEGTPEGLFDYMRRMATYMEEKKQYDWEQSRVIYIDLEKPTGGQAGFRESNEGDVSVQEAEIAELKKTNAEQKALILALVKQVKGIERQLRGGSNKKS